MTSTSITAERVREVLDYDRTTGVFTWTGASSRTGRARSTAGRPAGALAPNGYVKIGVDGVKHQAHRLAFLHVTGSLPQGEVDHINGDPSDNRWANLREASRDQNAQNLHGAHRDSRTGLLGVSQHSPTRFTARLRANGRTRHLGSFRTAEAAHAAYLSAKRTDHPFGDLPCPD